MFEKLTSLELKRLWGYLESSSFHVKDFYGETENNLWMELYYTTLDVACEIDRRDW